MTDLRNLLLGLLFMGLFSGCSYRFYSASCDKAMAGKLMKHAVLDSTVSENSGLLWWKGYVWTFNDSGGEPALYKVDPSSGSVLLKTVIRQAVNVDWEDIAMDDTYIYVADAGNNFHARDTLVIYRIPRKHVFTGDPQVDFQDRITLSFEDGIQIDQRGLSSLDCEALLVHKDSVYLFSKDWVGQSTSVYVFPARAGHHHLQARYTYDISMLVTGADWNPEDREVALVGYRNYMPVVVKYDFTGNPGQISCGGRARYYPFRFGRQAEGICYDDAGNLYLSSERSLHKPALFRVGRREP
jgi:hypothetical protein